MNKLVTILLLVVAALLAGCESREEKKRENALESAVFSYEGVMRWSYFDEVFQMYKPEDGQLLTVPASLSDVRITNYEVVYPLTVAKDGKRATQTVAISYVHEDQQIVRQIRNTQLWFFDEETQLWFLEPPVPEFP